MTSPPGRQAGYQRAGDGDYRQSLTGLALFCGERCLYYPLGLQQTHCRATGHRTSGVAEALRVLPIEVV